MNSNQELTEELIDAVISNDVDTANELLSAGADPNAVLDDANVTPMHHAAQNNSLEVIPLLVTAGAEINPLTEPDGLSPLDIALLHKHTKIVQVLTAYLSNLDAHSQ